jgi:hypothetical protein
LCLISLLGCNASSGEANGDDDVGSAGAEGDSPQEPLDPKCAGTPPVVPPELVLSNIGQQSYIVGPEGGMFDLTDEPSVTIVISPCAVDEPVRFTYLIQRKNPGGGDTEGATVFISFLQIPARLPGNSGYVNLHGKATLTWHDAPSPERAKVWTNGRLGYEPARTTVEGSDVSASTPLVLYLGFALGE